MQGAVRVEKNSAFSVEVAPTVSVVYLPGGRWSVSARFDRSHMYPTFEEMARAENGGAGKLKTAHSTGIDLGFILQGSAVDLRTTLFMRWARELTDWRQDAACGRYLALDASADTWGIETACAVRVGQWLRGSISYTLSRASDETGRDVEYLPTGLLAWDLRGEQAASEHISAGIRFSGRWTSSVAVGDRRQPCSGAQACLPDAALPAHVYGLLYGFVRIDSGRIYIRVSNLFNADIQHWWGRPPLPGRTLEFGASLTLVD
jgi:outer membrane cobalamin receptor